MNHNKAIKLLNYSDDKYYGLLNSLEPSYHMFSEREDEDFIISYIYMDGDGGAICLRGYSEMFNEHGLTMHLIECEYCELYTGMMLEISKEIEERHRENI